MDQDLLPYLMDAFPPGFDCQPLAGPARNQVIIRGYRFDPDALDARRLALLQGDAAQRAWGSVAA
jgi:hypothetical protein